MSSEQIRLKPRMKPISLFFLLSYVIFWSFLTIILIVILGLSLNPQDLPMFAAETFGIVGSYAPTIAAIIVLFKYGQKGAIKDLLKQYINFRASWKLYILSLLPLFVAFIGAFIGRAIYDDPLTIDTNFSFFPAILITFLLDIVKGPIGEEAGWRGFGYSTLREKNSFLKTSLIIGFFWAFWHTPLWLMDGWPITSILGFILTALATTLFMNWMRSQNQKSLVPVVLFHLSMNFSLQIVTNLGFNIVALDHILLIYGIIFVILATIFYALQKPKLY